MGFRVGDMTAVCARCLFRSAVERLGGFCGAGSLWTCRRGWGVG